ncbi:MAG: enoyl-CoA hydratase, partial [Pseudomonadota bacterium]
MTSASDTSTDEKPYNEALAAEAGDDLLFEVREGIGFITFNRPHARNAMTFAMYERLAQICHESNDDMRALVLTGAGGKAFAAGTDMSQFRAFETEQDALAYEERIDRVLGTLERCRVPTIAAIRGACAGGGAGIAVCCDLRVAEPGSRFGFPVARTLGNCLSMTGMARLADLIGSARLKDIVFRARLIGAEEAQQIGFINEVVEDAEA